MGDDGAAVVIGLLRAGLAPREAFVAAGWGVPGEDGAPPRVGAEYAVAARLAHATGAPLAPVLEACAASARDREETELVRDAALAGPRLSARVLAWLPLAGVAMSVLIDASVMRVFLTPFGIALTVVGVGLALAGRWWMRRLVSRASGSVSVDGLPLLATSAALAAGADIASAIAAVSNACEGEPSLAAPAAAMRNAALALSRGEPWEQAWAGTRMPTLERALRIPWERGAQAAPILEAAAASAALESRREAQIAANELAVRLTLPLSLCLLPAFVVVGIVPLVVALVGGVW